MGKKATLLFCAMLFGSIWWSITGCKPATEKHHNKVLTIRIPSEPAGLNPVFKVDGNSAQILNKILLPLMDFDPVTTELSPLLIDSLPQKLVLDTGRYKGKTAYTFRFRNIATWPNNRPLTFDDYSFSVKVALNKKIHGNQWSVVGSFIEDLIPSGEDRRKVTVVVKKDTKLAPYYIAGFELLPEYVYDPKALMRRFSLRQLKNREVLDSLYRTDQAFKDFVRDFEKETHIRTAGGVVGAGPYKLASWQSERVVLARKKNYWGEILAGKFPLLASYPDSLVYEVILDDVTTEVMLKNGRIDFVPGLNAFAFAKLKQNPQLRRRYNFFTSVTGDIFLLGINNRKEKFSKQVRNALARAVNVDEIIQSTSNGSALRITGPISPGSKYYDKSLTPLPYNPRKAANMLEQAGWVDRDGDGVREKEIHGNIQKLEADFLITSGSTSGTVAPIIKSNLSKVGVQLNIRTLPMGQFIAKLKSRDFDIALVKFSKAPGDYQPYGSWHSDNAGKSGRNYFGFQNPRADSIIEALSVAKDEKEKKLLYDEFQEILFDEQPAIFLFSPAVTIILSKRWEPFLTQARPGYIENAFRLKESE